MKAVLRLMLAYFTGTPILRWTTAFGLVCGIGGAIGKTLLPPLVAQNGLPSRFSLWQEALITLLPVIGLLCFAFGASLLPALATRLVASHYLYVLPYGRAKLLASIFGTITLIALFASAMVLAFYIGLNVPLQFVFSRTFVASLLTYSLVYVVLWFITRSRGAIAVVLGTVVIIATLVVPLRYINAPSTPTGGAWIACGVLWGMLAAGLMLAPRFKGIVGRARQAIAARSGGSSYHGGGEIAFMMGTARPWGLALGQVAPIALAAWLIPGLNTGGAAQSLPAPWLYFMTILSVLAGGTASLAATRSRSLWLRAHWTRAELFRRVEDAFWRYNSYTIGVLLITVAVIGDRFVLPTKLLAFGLGLVMLGTTISTYLGLMITATITWTQAALAVAGIGGLLMTAAYAADPTTSVAKLVAFEAALGVAALAFREIARRRWRDLDWMRCRPELGARAAT
jgi:hypothetical protein